MRKPKSKFRQGQAKEANLERADFVLLVLFILTTKWENKMLIILIVPIFISCAVPITLCAILFCGYCPKKVMANQIRSQLFLMQSLYKSKS